MTARTSALLAVALTTAAVAAAAGCGASPSSEPVAAAPSDGVAPARAPDTMPVEVRSVEPDAGDGTASDADLPEHEELSEADPSTDPTTDDDPTTTEDPDGGDDPDESSSTTTTPRRPLYISQKREPTGPGVPAIPSYTQTEDEIEYFTCVTFRESSNNPTVINGSSGAAGLFQFLQSTWDIVARRIGRYDLVGVNPALASVATQRYLAHVLFQWQGASPWVSDGCQLPHHPTSTTSPPTIASTTTTTRPATSTSSTTTTAPPDRAG